MATRSVAREVSRSCFQAALLSHERGLAMWAISVVLTIATWHSIFHSVEAGSTTSNAVTIGATELAACRKETL